MRRPVVIAVGILTITVVGTVVVVALSRLRMRPDGARNAELRAISAAARHSMQRSTAPDAAVNVRNGSAAIVRLPRGFAFVVPDNTTEWVRNSSGDVPRFRRTVRAVYSESGNFAVDGEVVFDGDVPETFTIRVKQWELSVGPNGDEVSKVGLPAFAPDDIHFELHRGTDWRSIDLATPAATQRRPQQ